MPTFNLAKSWMSCPYWAAKHSSICSVSIARLCLRLPAPVLILYFAKYNDTVGIWPDLKEWPLLAELVASIEHFNLLTVELPNFSQRWVSTSQFCVWVDVDYLRCTDNPTSFPSPSLSTCWALTHMWVLGASAQRNQWIWVSPPLNHFHTTNISSSREIKSKSPIGLSECAAFTDHQEQQQQSNKSPRRLNAHCWVWKHKHTHEAFVLPH